MPNQYETIEEVTRFLTARVPVIVLRAQEPGRAVEVVTSAMSALRKPCYIHSPATGLVELGRTTPVSDDRSLSGAVEYATQQFRTRPEMTFIFVDVDQIDSESPVARHFAEIARLAEEKEGSIVLISTGPVWSGLSRLGMTTTLDLPDVDEIASLVRALLDQNRRAVRIEWGEDEIRQGAEMLQGVTKTEVFNIVATLLASGQLLADDVARLGEYKDRIFGDLAGIERIKLKKTDFEVGGLETLRTWLAEREELMKADLTEWGLHSPRGVLLCGVPGCGKSLSAKAIATSWRLPLYRLDMASVLGMYVGESEGRLREAFETADRMAPCVLWIDEIEKGLAGGGDSGVTKRLIGQFLFWLQEHEAKVFLVATANDVTTLPPELLRKGRFDEVFFVDLPTEAEREEIIRLYFRRYLRAEPSPFLLQDLVKASEGFSGSDIEATCHELGASMLRNHTTQVPSDDRIRESFANTVPFSRSNPDDLAAIRAWGRERAVPASTQPIVADVPGAPHVRRVLTLS